jgi:hypothetical protein
MFITRNNLDATANIHQMSSPLKMETLNKCLLQEYFNALAEVR